MQTNLQNVDDNKKQIIAIILLCLSILIGFFFTIDQGYGYIEHKDTLNLAQKDVIAQKDTLDKLQIMKDNIEKDSTLQTEISRYGGEFREDTILDSIFSPANAGISIANISMSKGEKTANGLSLANISLSFKAQDTYTLSTFLNYLTEGKNNSKSYIIKNFSFPLDTTKNEAVSASIELSMYYFE
ncbi:MAG: hypothetical protein WC774_02855 [Candidatus Gracilibacteria bacterium]